MRRPLLLIALFGVLFAGPALAQPAPDPVAESHQLAKAMLAHIDVAGEVLRGMQGAGDQMTEFARFRPDWPQLMMDAMKEEITENPATFEDLFAEQFQKSFTVEEMEQGNIMFRDPAVQAVVAAAAAHQPAPPAHNPPCARPCMKAMQTPAGRSFLRKIAATNEIFGEPALREAVARIMPGVLIRFGQKAQAEEQARRRQLVK